MFLLTALLGLIAPAPADTVRPKRIAVYKRLCAVVFGGVGTLGDDQTLLHLNQPKAAYGAGLRFTVNKRDHLNLRLDYGLGRQSTGFYLTIGEAF